ncbi:hypothetical protein ACX80W_09695 [Arthrobacter sp. TMN-37]
MDERQAVAAVARAVDNIPAEHFGVWPGGWPGQVGMALVDAVYSIRATYRTTNPEKGVLGRVKIFRETYPDAAKDLKSLQSLGEEPIRGIMGNGKTGGRYKSECIIEAAENFLSLDRPVRRTTDLCERDPNHRRAYTRVKGLGIVTYEYFTMLLGKPGIKADRMIRGFVDSAIAGQGLPAVDAQTARRIVQKVHASGHSQIELQKFDHAIWIYQRDLLRNFRTVPLSERTSGESDGDAQRDVRGSA